MLNLPIDRMPEPEVALRLSIHIIANKISSSNLYLSFDGAHIKRKNKILFEPDLFLLEYGWFKIDENDKWQGNYGNDKYLNKIILHSHPGKGDLITELMNGKMIWVECKQGPIIRKKSSAEYPLIREALGQIITVQEYDPNAMYCVAIPGSKKFEELAERWREAPLIKKNNISIVTVYRSGEIRGFQL